MAGPVVHLSTATTWRGGEQQALYLATGLAARGIDNVVAAPPEAPLAERARAAGLRVAPLAPGWEWNPSTWWRLAALLRRENACLVHAHDAHGVTPAAFAGRLAGARRVCTRRVDFKLNSVWKYGWGMERVVCISDAIRRIVADVGVPKDKLRVVRSGIDLDRIRAGATSGPDARREWEEEGKKNKRLLVLNVAGLTDHKGQRYLLDAMPAVAAKVPQALLLIAGEGELRHELERQVNLLALEEHVVFTGFRDDVPALLHACDLFVMSSHLEGLCTSVMDAMAAGKAVVATSAGGLPELVEENVTGRLVPPKRPDALADALLDLLQDRKKRERLGRRAAEIAEKRFGLDAMVEGNLAVYRELGCAPNG